MTRDTDAIETRELTKRFGTEIAVDGLNLTVDHGTVYGFLGPNGGRKNDDDADVDVADAAHRRRGMDQQESRI